jgi:6-pyruvoyltetrahydropterin/6-carboxytetrahydropterin synthase
MVQQQRISISREIRFVPGGRELKSEDANTFAANPPCEGIGPVLSLSAVVEGPVDSQTGMMVNIKRIDRVLREVAVPLFACEGGTCGPARISGLLLDCYQQSSQRLLPHKLSVLRLAPSQWTHFEIHQKEVPMMRMALRFEFSAAHRLHSNTLDDRGNAELFGKCNSPNAHGHNYELEVIVGGKPDPATGLILPLGEFQRIVNAHVIRAFDHKHLNLDCPEFANLNPTVENIARVIFDKLREAIKAPVQLKGVRVWETPKTCCEVLAE